MLLLNTILDPTWRMDMTYKPKPIDLSDIILSDNLQELIELLARNTHKVWAETRIKNGWTYGKKRDDILKQHPCLLPYNEILDSEKEYDRTIALNIVKLMIKLGYNIDKCNT